MAEWSNKYNPFNSYKALVHVPYWSSIKDGIIPPPLFMSIDLNDSCQFRCSFCNAKKKLDAKYTMSAETIQQVLNTLVKFKTRAVCLGGGGESTLNHNMPLLIKGLYDQGIKIGVVTNGYETKNLLPVCDMCEWIGISVDAGIKETYMKVKGVKDGAFDRVKQNIKEYAARCKEVSLKYLVLPENSSEVYKAAKMAKELGCDVFHARPGSFAWFDNPDKDAVKHAFSEDQIDDIINQIDYARNELEDDKFKVYGITHKFAAQFQPKKPFKKCYAAYTTCVVHPDGMVGICCDLRGAPNTVLCHVSELPEVWGSQKHKDMVSSICVEKCPRCTLIEVQNIFENVILNDDKMLCDFI